MRSEKLWLPTAALFASLDTSSGAQAAMVTAVNVLSGSPVAAGGDFSGADTHHDGVVGIYAGTGFSAAESFIGQTVALVSGYEVVSGVPGGPLSLNTPAAANGVTLWGAGRSCRV